MTRNYQNGTCLQHVLVLFYAWHGRVVEIPVLRVGTIPLVKYLRSTAADKPVEADKDAIHRTAPSQCRPLVCGENDSVIIVSVDQFELHYVAHLVTVFTILI